MNLENKVKNRFNISEILKKLLFRVSKLEKNSNVPSGDFIPLTGTEEGKPITGDLKIESYSGKKIKSFLQGEGGNAIDLTRVDEGLVLESYYGQGIDGVKNAELVVHGVNVMYIPMNGAEEYSVGFTSSMDHSDNTSGSAENDKFIYTQRSYVDKANSYSTDEIKTGGTWIDGKPIYRKVIPFTLPDGIVSQTFVLDLSTLNAEIVIKNEAKLFNDDDQWIDEQLIFNGGFAYHFFSKIVFPNLIEIAYLSTFLSTGDTTSIQNNMSGKIILEYTKTTD